MFLCQRFITSLWTKFTYFSKSIYILKLKICCFWSWLFLLFFLLRIFMFLFTFNLFNLFSKIDFSFYWSLFMTLLGGIGLILVWVLGVDWIFNPRLTYSWWSDKFISLLFELRFFIINFFLFDLAVKFELFSIRIEPIMIRVIKL